MAIGLFPNRIAAIGAVVRQNMGRSLGALSIKIAAAGLSYLMFVVLSRVMGLNAYGEFAAGFALATMLAIGAGLGQHMVILRLWPEAQGAGRAKDALLALRAGWALTLLAGGTITLLLMGVTALFGLGGGGVSYLYGAAALILPMAAAEYLSAALRAQGSVLVGLGPRDILWRGSVPLFAWLLFLAGVQFSGFWALVFTGFALVLVLAAQLVAARANGFANQIGFVGLSTYWRQNGGMVFWVWVATLLDTAALNLDVVLVGALMSPDASGLFLNAFRTAGLMTLFLFAINQVVAPRVAQHFHAQEFKATQTLVSFTAWAGFVFALGVFGLFVMFGPNIMGLFGAEYVSGAPILLILAAGLMVDAATGPTRIVMMMTGYERAYVGILAATSAIALVAAIAVIPLFGVMGAAIVNALARLVTQCTLVWRTRRLVGIDPSILGALLPARRVIA